MASVQLLVTIPAGETNENVLQGNRFERSPFQIAKGSLFCTGSAAGLTCELNVGSRSITSASTVNDQDRLPVVPDDLFVDGWVVASGELIQIRVVNTTIGDLDFAFKMELEEQELVEG